MFSLIRFLFVRGDHLKPYPGQVRSLTCLPQGRLLGQSGFFLGRVGVDHLTYLPATVTGPRQAVTIKSPRVGGTVKGG